MLVESLDTNIIVRLVTHDIDSQYRRALKLIRRADAEFYIDDAVVAEAVHVLEGRGYDMERGDIVTGLLLVLDRSCMRYNAERINDAFDFYLRHPKLSYVDCYLHFAVADQQAEPLWTFDHKLAVQSGVAKEVE